MVCLDEEKTEDEVQTDKAPHTATTNENSESQNENILQNDASEVKSANSELLRLTQRYNQIRLK